MSDLVNVLPQHLTQDEVEFVYNVEVLGLPAKKAATMAGMSPAKIMAPHVMQARDNVKREMRGRMKITKEDVVHGYLDAIDRAKVLGEPATEIMGWKHVEKILGYDAPQKIDINISASIDVMQRQVRGMDDATLAKMIGAENVIDADFYEVGRDPAG